MAVMEDDAEAVGEGMGGALVMQDDAEAVWAGLGGALEEALPQPADDAAPPSPQE